MIPTVAPVLVSSVLRPIVLPKQNSSSTSARYSSRVSPKLSAAFSRQLATHSTGSAVVRLLNWAIVSLSAS